MAESKATILVFIFDNIVIEIPRHEDKQSITKPQHSHAIDCLAIKTKIQNSLPVNPTPTLIIAHTRLMEKTDLNLLIRVPPYKKIQIKNHRSPQEGHPALTPPTFMAFNFLKHNRHNPYPVHIVTSPPPKRRQLHKESSLADKYLYIL